MARRRARYTANAVDPDPIILLWLLRILVPLGGHRKFVRSHGFNNDTLAEVIGLGHWIDPSPKDFDLKAVQSELRLLHQKAEKQWAKAPLPACLRNNVGQLSDLVGLSTTDCRILEFAVSIHNERLLDDTADWLGQISSVKVFHALSAILNLPEPEEEVFGEEDQKPVRLAVAGRPNAGKSTLINTWLGEERLVAFDMPGTTRDAITVPFERNGQKFELIDTAGLRRKGKVFEAIEKFSVVKTLQAIEGANVVLLLIDATQGVTDQDAHIAGYILESGRSVVLGINKWDAVDDYQRQMLERSIETRLSFLKFAPLHFISAQKRQGLEPLWKSIIQAHRAATCKMPTPVLTRILMESIQFQTPKKVGAYRPKMRYAHQGGMNPPIIVIHGNSLELVTDAYKRFLEGRFRKEFNLVGTPLRIDLKTSHNPYADKD